MGELRGSSFVEKVQSLREKYLNQPNLFRYWREAFVCKADRKRTHLKIWYGPGKQPVHYVCITPVGGNTLSDALLQFERDLPVYDKSLEIVGHDWHETSFVAVPVAGFADDDFEDCSVELSTLPLITPSDSLHFTKKPSYRSEIQNLLLCRGSPYVVQLCGVTPEGLLVFSRLKEDMFKHSMRNASLITVSSVKRFMSHLIDALTYLHSRATKSVVIADLQSRWGTVPCLAPECWEQQNFTFSSDVYAIGKCLVQFIVLQNARHPFVKYTVPAPFDVIHAACTAEDPEKRPSLEELRIMVYNIVD